MKTSFAMNAAIKFAQAAGAAAPHHVKTVLAPKSNGRKEKPHEL